MKQHTGYRLIGVCLLALYLSSCSSISSFHVENDMLVDELGDLFDKDINDDRNLTMTLGVSWIPEENPTWIDKAHKRLISWTPVIKLCEDESEMTNTVGVTAFTPKDITTVTPIFDDRPFASLVYWGSGSFLGCSEHSIDSTEYLDDVVQNNDFKTIYRTNLNLGVLGLEIAKEGQRIIHNQLGASEKNPKGWNNQISDGGEITAMASLERLSMLKLGGEYSTKYDLSYSTGLDIGYYTNLNFGADFRISVIDQLYSPFYNNGGSRIGAGVEGLQPLGEGLAPVRAALEVIEKMKDTYGVENPDRFFFIGFRTRIVGYNALLQGAFRDSRVEFSDDDIERVVTQSTIGYSSDMNGWCKLVPGISNSYCNSKFSDGSTRMTFSAHHRTKEYESPTHGREHWWAGLYFDFVPNYLEDS